jgi:hypothetical protein
MNRKFILIGLLMAVFAFPANDSFVEAWNNLGQG